RVVRQSRCAAPWPVTGFADESGSLRIALHVSQNVQQVPRVADHKVLEPPLIQVAASNRVVNALMLPNVRIEQKAHVRRNILPVRRAKDKMKVRGHQIIGEQVNVDALRGLAHQREKPQIIIDFWKQELSIVRAVQHVLRVAVRRDTTMSRHREAQQGFMSRAVVANGDRDGSMDGARTVTVTVREIRSREKCECHPFGRAFVRRWARTVSVTLSAARLSGCGTKCECPRFGATRSGSA